MKSALPACTALALLVPHAAGQWSTATLSQARSRLAATSVGSRSYFAGGWLGLSNYSDVVDVYDANTGSWTTASLSAPRSELAATSAEGIALFAGGRNAHGAVAAVDVFDPASGTWTTATLSEARSRLAATSVGPLAFFAGGWRGYSDYSDAVDVYDTRTGCWTTASLSQARGQLAATSVDELAFFAGGRHPTSVTDRVDVLNVATGTWSTRELSSPRSRLVGAQVHRLVLFAGGGDTVDVLDMASGSWTVTSLSTWRFDVVATTVGHRVVIAGGSGAASNTVEIYDATTRTWDIAPLSIPRRELAATTSGGRALLAGGMSNSTLYARVDIFQPELGTRYCSPAAANSTGMPAWILADGSPWVASNDVALVAAGLPPGEFGYFLVGSNQGQFQPPGSQGTICITCSGFQGCAGIGRYNQVGNIIQGPAGNIAIDLTALPLTPPRAVVAGETWNFQCWFRDLGSSNFTDAVSVTFR